MQLCGINDTFYNLKQFLADMNTGNNEQECKIMGQAYITKNFRVLKKSTLFR